MEQKQSCGTCSKVFGDLQEESPKVTCKGPCRKTFHAACADLDLALVNVCTKKVGLLWFCQNCRLDFDEGARQRRSVLQATVQRMMGELQKLVERVESIDGDEWQSNQEAVVPGVKRRIPADLKVSKKKRNDGVGELVGEPMESTNKDGSCTEVVVAVTRKTNPEFPVKIWTEVLKHLNFEDLRQARLVSGQWKNIVDGCFMGKFSLKFPSSANLGDRVGHQYDRHHHLHRHLLLHHHHHHHLENFPMLPASPNMFEFERTFTARTWRSLSITEKLENLELNYPNISLTTLLEMLRYTPNLVSLSCELTYIHNGTFSNFSDLRLEKMRNLTLYRVQQANVLEVFSRMCPRLKCFKLLSNYRECYQGVLEMIRSVPSLEEISLVSSSNDLSHLAVVNRQFKRVSIKITTLQGETLKENLTKFSRNQPLLECLDLKIHTKSSIDSVKLSKDIDPIFRNLLKLKRVSLNILDFPRNVRTPVVHWQSIGYLTELEYFEYNGDQCGCSILLGGARNPKLKELSLKGVKFSNDLQDYIANAHNLRIITLNSTHLFERTHLFTAIQLKDLRCLKLEKLQVYTMDGLCEYMDGLRYLEIVRCSIPKLFLKTLFGLCPRLEELHLEEIKNFSDSVVLESFQKMRHLRKLTINKCPITDHSARHIAENALNLKELTIESCKKLTNEGITQLKVSKIALLNIH